MSSSILSIAGAMFGIPLILLTLVAIIGDIPPLMLWAGGWSMALGIILGGIGAVVSWYGG